MVSAICILAGEEKMMIFEKGLFVFLASIVHIFQHKDGVQKARTIALNCIFLELRLSEIKK